ncbi:lipopolysaccharide biosynthesis protein [Methanofollis formosanus]|uniref:Lipopolysaccharide biosynthesis protein n=1 Tax=Methanofollis formosanus TaxID=299308 RepID=A0A8G1A2E6_9EURY|nr:oligosaccharide flippase family protein [Methanofollis formosanus]QYZ79835.1 lipopolysaccharide biosynthesis protein [Methanofollis formosanus]
MDISLPKTIPEIHDYLRNPFYKNSFYITLGRFADVGFGFLFWTLAARLYTVGEVGIATALISSLGLVMAFSRLGFDITIIRFMPSNDHSRVFNTCLWITTGATIVVGIIYLAAIDLISPEIAFIRDYASLFLLFAIVNSVTLITGKALLSFRKADFKFVQNLIMGVRLPLLLPLALLGSLGIFYAFGFAYLAAAVFALVMLRGYVTLTPPIDREFIRKTFRFSSLNYLANIFQSVPSLVMPILIVNLLSPEEAALYYVAFAIGNLVLIIPNAMSTSFFIEGSHGINLRRGVIRNLTVTYIILTPTVLFIVIFGEFLLGLFGKDYLAAFDLLRIIAVSSLFVTAYNLFIPLQNIRLQVGGIMVMNLIRFVLLLGLSYIFLIQFGVIGAGYAWVLTYMILGLGIILIAKGKGWV